MKRTGRKRIKREGVLALLEEHSDVASPNDVGEGGGGSQAAAGVSPAWTGDFEG
jgi:hypothetical protein